MFSRPQIQTVLAKYLLIVLIAGCAVVHVTASNAFAQAAKPKKTVEQASRAKLAADPAKQPLPAAVIDMLDGIQSAIRSGRIEDLQPAIAWNELPPTFDVANVEDPIAFWRKQSSDGQGREILAILAAIIDAGHTVLPVGRDIENNRLYVWPRYADMALDKLTPEDEVQLYRLIKPADLRTMREKKRWLWYRLAIGADGTWHSFQKAE